MSAMSRRAAIGCLIAAGVMPFRVSARVEAPSPLLWQAWGPQGSAFLFGQMPARTDTPWQVSKVVGAFEASGTLWLENPVFTPTEAQALSVKMSNQPRLTTTEFLGESDLNRLRSQLRRAGLAPTAFDELPADELFQQLSALADVRSGADFTALPDRYFRERARAAGKAIETEWQSLAEVATFMPPAPDPVRLQLIRMGMDQYDMAANAGERLDAWIDGDAQYFERVGAITANRYPELFAKLSGERNRRLAGRLAAAMARPGQHFVCVGIGHVTGPASIQSFLLNMGIPVERV